MALSCDKSVKTVLSAEADISGEHCASGMREIRILLIGKTGVGKSALGNSLLGTSIFISKASFSTQTAQCTLGERTLDDGTVLRVVDTPGLFSNNMTGQECSSTLVNAFRLLGSNGAHVFLYVIKGSSRFTQEDQDAKSYLQMIFGDSVVKHFVVVVTGKNGIEEEGMTFLDFVKTSTGPFTKLLQECGNRISAIENRAPMNQREKDAQTILNLIRETISSNGELSCYSEKMFKDVQAATEQGNRMDETERNAAMKQELTKLTQNSGYNTAVAANSCEASCNVL